MRAIHPPKGAHPRLLPKEHSFSPTNLRAPHPQKPTENLPPSGFPTCVYRQGGGRLTNLGFHGVEHFIQILQLRFRRRRGRRSSEELQPRNARRLTPEDQEESNHSCVGGVDALESRVLPGFWTSARPNKNRRLANCITESNWGGRTPKLKAHQTSQNPLKISIQSHPKPHQTHLRTDLEVSQAQIAHIPAQRQRPTGPLLRPARDCGLQRPFHQPSGEKPEKICALENWLKPRGD